MDEGVASDAVDARDRELGSIMRTWAQARDGLEVEVLGPLDAHGMDPTWVLRLRSELLEAHVCLFRGPFMDVSAFRPTAVEAGAFVGGEEGLSDARLIQMLDALADAGMGADLPTWLRPAGL